MHAIYQGTVSHSRLFPKKHSFKYTVHYLYIDLDHYSTLFKKNFFYSVDKFNFASISRKNYLGKTSQSIKQSVIQLLQKSLNLKFSGKIFLLTTPSFFGYCFNPVSFYYCYEKTQLVAIISHITNTPWGEKYAYIHDCRKKDSEIHKFKIRKNFHVSPFIPMDIDYEWYFQTPKDFLLVSMNNFYQNKLQFNAELRLIKKAMTNIKLYKMLLLSLPMSIKAIVLIYWHALLIKLKGNPFYSHPKNND
ncbi:MAG: DUF1365 domain-containing protein [Nitrosomonadales bacterium]